MNEPPPFTPGSIQATPQAPLKTEGDELESALPYQPDGTNGNRTAASQTTFPTPLKTGGDQLGSALPRDAGWTNGVEPVSGGSSFSSPPGNEGYQNESTGSSGSKPSGSDQPAALDKLKTEGEKLKSAVVSEASETGSKIKEEAKAAVGNLREAGMRYAATGKDTLSQKAKEYADAVGAVSNKLSESGEPNLLAGPAQAASQQLNRLSQYLRDSDPRQIMQGLNGLARRRPELFFGGLFIAGLIGARFVKASGSRAVRNVGAGTGTPVGAGSYTHPAQSWSDHGQSL
ncbi:MAG: hypothetical protein EOP86_06775 [Verrucomicrobiaceae bacterium]|nr:MAG: hypothetical protein EOP86_06775 [Verrucomicrobiaceae bacterium]